MWETEENYSEYFCDSCCEVIDSYQVPSEGVELSPSHSQLSSDCFSASQVSHEHDQPVYSSPHHFWYFLIETKEDWDGVEVRGVSQQNQVEKPGGFISILLPFLH